MKRHAAHGRTLFEAAVAACQHEIEFLARKPRIVKKHFVKITETKEQKAVRILLFYFKVLFHHWRQSHII